MSFIGNLLKLFNIHTIARTEAPKVEQPHPSELTPLDLPPLSCEEREFSDFEKRRSLQKFHDICTQELVEKIADEISIRQLEYSPALRSITDLMAEFDNSASMGEDYLSLDNLSSIALRGRNAEFLNDIADEMYKPYSQLDNERFIEEVRKCALGEQKPALRII